jgi:hypothetical protein
MVDAVKVVTGSTAGQIGAEDGGTDMVRTRGSAEEIAEVVRLDNDCAYISYLVAIIQTALGGGTRHLLNGRRRSRMGWKNTKTIIFRSSWSGDLSLSK